MQESKRGWKRRIQRNMGKRKNGRERERCSWEKSEEKGKSGNVSDIEKERVRVKERFRRRMETERRERRGENGRE